MKPPSKEVFLDNAVGSRPSEGVVTAMHPYLRERWGVPSAPHRHGQRLLGVMEEAYRALYDLFGAKDEDTILVTSSGVEAVHQVITSVFYDVCREQNKNHFVTSAIDEAPAVMAIGRLEKLGCTSSTAVVDKGGYVTAQAIAEAITPRTALVSLSWACGLTGVVHPVEEIAELCRRRGILLHLDASHVLGKLFLDLERIAPDFVTFGGGSIHGPQASGGVYVREGVPCKPFIAGQGVASLVGLGVAAREAMESRDSVCMEVARLRDKLENMGAVVFFRESERLPHITACAFPGVVNDALLYALDRQGVYASFGGGQFQRIALILKAAGVDPVLSHCGVSFALSKETTEEEIDRVVACVSDVVKRLRKTSEVWDVKI